MPDDSASKAIGIPFIELQSVDSTNNYARKLISASQLTARQSLIPHGTAVFSHEQTAGKGQRGNTWFSGKGQDIILSVVIDPAQLGISDIHLASKQFLLTAATAIATCKWFSGYAGEDTKIKWPNDLYWQDRKAAGILIETGSRSLKLDNPNQAASKFQWAIAGIGVNINQTSFPPELPNPVSLKQITGKEHNPLHLGKELCQYLGNYFELIKNSRADLILSEYNEKLYKRNLNQKLKVNSRLFNTVIKGVDENGRLITGTDLEERFEFGQVQWVTEKS